jgi:hypothetical protein
MISLDNVQLETFESLVGCVFTTGGVRLEMSAVKALGHRHEAAVRAPLSVLFRGAQGLRLPQGTYRFECEDLSEIEIFITQVADGAEGSEFEAVFT